MMLHSQMASMSVRFCAAARPAGQGSSTRRLAKPSASHARPASSPTRQVSRQRTALPSDAAARFQCFKQFNPMVLYASRLPNPPYHLRRLSWVPDRAGRVRHWRHGHRHWPDRRQSRGSGAAGPLPSPLLPPIYLHQQQLLKMRPRARDAPADRGHCLLGLRCGLNAAQPKRRQLHAVQRR